MTMEMSNLELWVTRARNRSKESFMEFCCPNPVLVVSSAAAVTDIGYQTVDTVSMKAIDPGLHGARVAVLEGPGTAPFREYNIGRTENNDIVIQDPKISKLHAKIKRLSDSTKIIDVSKNGTLVNGKVLRDAELPLERQTEISIGNVQLRYYLPAEFYAFLQNVKK